MASVIPSSHNTVVNATTSFSTHPLHKRLQIPAISSRRYLSSSARKVSCKSKNNEEHSSLRLDRRDVLIGIGGLYGSTSLSNADPLAMAAPIMPPDLSKCGPPDLPAGAKPTNCCPPNSSKIIDFKLPPPSSPMRVRQAAHLVNGEYIAKYSKAIELMKALPSDDPRCFTQQANIHCAYCDGAYDQIGFPGLEIEVHSSWLFFPWHRYYLYFFEKICGKLINDPTFALPFWNYDSPEGMQIPKIYTNPRSPLYDELRDPKHQPPTVIDLDYNGVDPNTTPQQQIESNLFIMYRQMVSNAKTTQLFLGAPYRAGDQPNPGAGSIESEPHNTVHLWTGDRRQPNRENMGSFYSAGRDPIFYAHHSNIDRFWTIWKGLGGKRKDYTDPDWLNSGFLFYDENAQLTRVKIQDSLDEKKLRYRYQEVDLPWLKIRPTPRKARVTPPTAGDSGGQFPRALDSVVKTVVKRPKKSRNSKEKEEEEEVLVIYGIEFDRNVFVKFDVFINEDDETASGPTYSEFAGSFVHVPHKHQMKMKTKTTLRLGITDLLEDLMAEDDDTVVVTLVPRQGKDVLYIGGLKIEFSS
ncbi:polyphenol oxidase, chloroplastic-like [Macadamia integrifolia]|uniref:polyphenol oxidase, chloroplastic-like n=1 Tax=Macadamia integrifolia TaxID=60698 RepID=UPI001C52CB3D|nr:polyphenol oxidase, chloroplastic-like [Macadamia integrifolia]